MNGFNFNTGNPLMQEIAKYINNGQTQEQSQSSTEQKSTNYTGIKVYEIQKKEDLTYIKPDDTGQKQIIICDNDKTIYVARYNYSDGKPDHEEYISKGYIDLFKKDTNNEIIETLNNVSNSNTENMTKIAEALSAVVDKLEYMKNEILEIKDIKPVSGRNSKGQFTKRSDSWWLRYLKNCLKF